MTTVLDLRLFLMVAGMYVACVAWEVARDATHPHRVGSAIFWGLLAAIFLAGDRVPAAVVGYAVLFMAVLAGLKQVGMPRRGTGGESERAREATRLGNRLIWPVAVIPMVVIAGAAVIERVEWRGFRLVEPRHATQVALGAACLLALGLAWRVTRPHPAVAVTEGSRLLQAIGWALLLPPLLASLGGIFARAGVGDVVADLVRQSLPTHDPLVAVVAYCGGMALFTIVMGNAFAAFPVMTLGVGLPFIVREHGGNPAIMGALGMLSGYCGTLVTPMAANFNLVPAMLLELEDRNAVIKAQAPMAAVIWVFNVALMYACVYRF
jgi:uncharacterized membrane protein